LTVFESNADIDQLMLGYHGKRYDPSGALFLGADAYLSPGNLSGRNNNADFQLVRPGAKASYFYSRAYLERRWYLPRNLELMGRVTGQLADGNLLPTEQLGIGGYNSVRGYDINSALGDSGLFANLELRTRPVCVGLGSRCRKADELGPLEDEITAHIFYDFGEVFLHSPLRVGPVQVEKQSMDLHAVGIGCRYALQRRFSLRADYGWGLSNVTQLGQPPQPRHRIHLGAVLSY
jgi:hemolysin activation/secretion protein